MSDAVERRSALHGLEAWLETPMVLLSIAWFLLVLVELTLGASRLLETLGIVIWAIFILEFLLRLTLAPDKRDFLRSNWLTILALAVPALRIFRAIGVLRAARALRSFRLVRIVGTANRSMLALRRTLSRRRFGYVMALTMLVIGLGGGGMLSFESAHEVSGGMESYPHALWWTTMLVTSIGSDFWPTTTEGRILAVLLAIYGLAVFGYVTATFASFFVGRDSEEPGGPLPSNADIGALLAEVRSLRAEIARRNGS